MVSEKIALEIEFQTQTEHLEEVNFNQLTEIAGEFQWRFENIIHTIMEKAHISDSEIGGVKFTRENLRFEMKEIKKGSLSVVFGVPIPSELEILAGSVFVSVASNLIASATIPILNEIKRRFDKRDAEKTKIEMPDPRTKNKNIDVTEEVENECKKDIEKIVTVAPNGEITIKIFNSKTWR